MSSHSPSPAPGAQRKPHCCRSCGLPMKGHQRGACIQSSPMQPRASPPLMPPPDSIPTGPSQSRARFPSPSARPIMPGAYANERPSEVSASTGHGFGPAPTRSLRDRIGAKVEETSSFDFHDYSEDIYGQQYSRHTSASIHGYPTRTIAGSASGYAASASGSAYGSSSTVVLPEHSISQRFIRRDRAVSENTNSLAGRLADRLGGYTDDDFIGPDNDEDGSFEYDDSYDYGESESDPAYPSDGSAIGEGASASYYASESEAGTITTSGHSSAPSFGALIRGSGAAPLYIVYEVASKFVGLLRRRAKRKGWAVRVLPTEDENDVDEYGRRKRSSREPGNVRILLGRDEDALREVERQQRAGQAMTAPVRRIRIRSPPNNVPPRHPSPHVSPPPLQLQNPYPSPQPGVAYPLPASVAMQQPQPQGTSLRSVCLTVTATVVVLIVLLFAAIGFFVIVARPAE